MATYDPNYDTDYDPDCAEATCSLVTLCKRIAVGHNVDECFDTSKAPTLDGFKVDYKTALAIAKKIHWGGTLADLEEMIRRYRYVCWHIQYTFLFLTSVVSLTNIFCKE